MPFPILCGWVLLGKVGLLWLLSYKVFSGPVWRNLNFFLEVMGEPLEISEQADNMLKKYFRKIYLAVICG